MNLNPPRPVRAVLYLTATFATPTVLWASTEGHIGNALTVLFGSYIAIVMGLATANTAATPTDDEAGAIDVGTAIVIALLVVLVLVLVGVIR